MKLHPFVKLHFQHHLKPNIRKCTVWHVPSEDSDQLANFHILILIFTGCILEAKDVKFLHGIHQRLIRVHRCAGWFESVLGAHLSEDTFSYVAPHLCSFGMLLVLHSSRWLTYSKDTFLLFLHENLSCGYSLELPQWGNSNEYPQNRFWCKLNKKKYHDAKLILQVLTQLQQTTFWFFFFFFIEENRS